MNTQCGKFGIFLLLRFYVNSIFENQEHLDLPKLSHDGSKIVKMTVLDTLDFPKIDFTEN